MNFLEEGNSLSCPQCWGRTLSGGGVLLRGLEKVFVLFDQCYEGQIRQLAEF